jgi:signal transduction histidine kinase
MNQKKRILIVEDEYNLVNMIRMNLEAEGYEVTAAYDGLEGLSRIQSESPDLVICDVMMPRMDGLELCQRIRENRDTDSMPFIFLTAKTEIPEKLSGFQAGADDYITKPFHMDELVARVHAILTRVDRLREDSQDMFKNASRDLNRLSSLGILAASIAHEVRNQLTSVVGNAELLRLTNEEPVRDQYASIVLNHINRINHTVSSMLEFARHKTVKYELHRVEDIVGAALELTRARLLAQKVMVSMDIPDALPSVYGDQQQICQVLVNLIINAVQAVKEEEGRIEVRAAQDEDELVLQVSDNGCGIPAAMMEKLFTPFTTSKQQSGGIGLGLYISKEIITAHRGRIQVQSEEGKGTCFTLRFPVLSSIPSNPADFFAQPSQQ